MPRLEADFTTWLSSSPTFSSGFTQWLWNDFWLQDYLDLPVEELEFETTAESGDEGERPGNEPEDPPEDDDDPTEPEVEDDPEPEDDPVGDGRDDPVEDPEDDPVEDDPEDDPEDEPEDDEEDTGGGDDPDPAPSDTEDTEEGVGTSGYVSVPCGPFPGFFDPLGHFLSLFNDRFGGVDVIGMMTSGACQAAAPDISTQFEDEFVFIPSDPEPVTPNLDDLALSDLLPDEPDDVAPQMPVDDWFF